jgi:membrane protein
MTSTLLAAAAGMVLVRLVAGGGRTTARRPVWDPRRTGQAGREAGARGAGQHAPAAAASEPGRGREADTPTEIPARGWKDILWRTYKEFGQDRLMSVAAGVTYYALLALFPAIGVARRAVPYCDLCETAQRVGNRTSGHE